MLSCSQSLIETHDQVAAKSFETLPSAANNTTTMSSSSLMPVDTVRMISIQKKAGEPLVRELMYSFQPVRNVVLSKPFI